MEFNLNKDIKKSVVNENKRNYANDLAKHWLGQKAMSKQAKTLTAQELRRVMDYIATRKHAARNRAMLMMTHLAGLRVGEVAALRYSDIVEQDGTIRTEFTLTAEQTKGNYARTVFVSDRLRKELQTYVSKLTTPVNNAKLFYTQKNAVTGFTANTLTQYFHYLYKGAGLNNCSSHSGRRTFITNLASKGVGVRVIMGLSGHRALSSVQHYIDCNDEMKRNAVNLLN